MNKQRVILIGVAALTAVALLVPATSAYAQRQRTAAKAASVRAAHQAVEVARWTAMAEWYAAHASAEAEDSASLAPHVYDSTGAMLNAMGPASVGASGLRFKYVDGTTASLLAAAHPWATSESGSANAPSLLANWYYPAMQAAPAQSLWTSKPASPVTAPGSAVNWYYQP
jgi:hypothetical protein